MQKPYNFVLSPILVQPSSDCTPVAPASKHSENRLAREYTEIHTGEMVKLASEYNGKTSRPKLFQTLYGAISCIRKRSPLPQTESSATLTRAEFSCVVRLWQSLRSYPSKRKSKEGRRREKTSASEIAPDPSNIIRARLLIHVPQMLG